MFKSLTNFSIKILISSQETPGRLEYEVALYKEAPPLGRISGQQQPQPPTHGHPQLFPKNGTSLTANNEVPVDQAVPIGTKLQLRARISIQSVWKYVKLMEVTVSPDPVSFCCLFLTLLVSLTANQSISIQLG